MPDAREGGPCVSRWAVGFSLGIEGEPQKDFEQEWGFALTLGGGWTWRLACSLAGQGEFY